MSSVRLESVTRLLLSWSAGNREAQELLLLQVYDDLRRIAKLHLRREREPDLNLQPTVLVHEAYLRLADRCNVHWQDRAHFFAVVATTMRRILVEQARSRNAAKRDEGKPKLPLLEAAGVTDERPPDLVALDDCLTALAKADPLKASIVELRFFGGLSVKETAKVVGRSRATVIRQWKMAKAWLYHELSGEGEMVCPQSA